MLALEGPLALRREATLRVIRAAVELDQPTPEALSQVGVPRWDAQEAVRRLTGAGELDARGWLATSRLAYRGLLVASLEPGTSALERRNDSERPREKALRGGIDTLADVELVALLLRTGSGSEGVLELAQRLLDEHHGIPGLARKLVEELAVYKGLGPAKAAELAAAFEIGRRLASAVLRDRPTLKTPEAIAALLAGLAAGLAHEEFWCLPLDARSRLIGEPRQIARGDIDSTDAPPRAFCRAALSAGAVATVAVHNHPSGDPTPSAADIQVTIRLVLACRAIDVPLHDHLVLGDAGRFFSIRRSHPQCWRV
jgi:DNA repair protein RadC